MSALWVKGWGWEGEVGNGGQGYLLDVWQTRLGHHRCCSIGRALCCTLTLYGSTILSTLYILTLYGTTILSTWNTSHPHCMKAQFCEHGALYMLTLHGITIVSVWSIFHTDIVCQHNSVNMEHCTRRNCMPVQSRMHRHCLAVQSTSTEHYTHRHCTAAQSCQH